MVSSRFGFDLVGIGGQLENQRLAVPIYQRDYAWGGDNSPDAVTDFWNDLKTTFGRSGEHYFLGTIVLAETDAVAAPQMVIDGQQRLATTAILLAAIRDEFKMRGDADRARIVQQTYLAKPQLRSGSQIPQLTLNAEDDAYFRSLVAEGTKDATPTRTSHKLIHDAYQYLRGEIGKVAEGARSEWEERLTDWIDFLAARVQVIAVTVPSESDAFLIFETLNDRGADLTIADLLKNYLFGRARSRLDTVRNAWVSTMATLDLDVQGGALFTDFLRHYWSSKYGATRERDLYKAIKERVISEAQAVDFARELEAVSRLYAAILNSDHEIWSEMGTITKAHVDALRTLNLEQHRPLLLALLQHFEARELRRAMRAMVAWGVRGLIVGGIGGGRTERLYCDAAIRVRRVERWRGGRW